MSKAHRGPNKRLVASRTMQEQRRRELSPWLSLVTITRGGVEGDR
jgi:hypothetical protein